MKRWLQMALFLALAAIWYGVNLWMGVGIQ